MNELAQKVQETGGKFGLDVRIQSLPNPRKEAEDHYYNPVHTGLLDLGLKPHYLTNDVLEGMFRVVERYKDNIREDVIFRGVRWG